jgi:hypothetical protein
VNFEVELQLDAEKNPVWSKCMLLVRLKSDTNWILKGSKTIVKGSNCSVKGIHLNRTILPNHLQAH